jgi:hypothetical protein
MAAHGCEKSPMAYQIKDLRKMILTSHDVRPVNLNEARKFLRKFYY